MTLRVSETVAAAWYYGPWCQLPPWAEYAVIFIPQYGDPCDGVVQLMAEGPEQGVEWAKAVMATIAPTPGRTAMALCARLHGGYPAGHTVYAIIDPGAEVQRYSLD